MGGLRMHPRYFLVNKAELELTKWLLDWEQRHQLTEIEIVQCLQRRQSNMLKYMLRDERHPDDGDKKGDEA